MQRKKSLPGKAPNEQAVPDQTLKKYIYLGDRWTDPIYKGQISIAVLNPNGKCTRGRNGNMLVSFGGIKVVVSARLLRKHL